MTIMEYPRQYEGCPLLPMEVIHHFLRSSESWLSLGLQNLLLMHCERGGWPVLAFMLAALLIYRRHYTGELKTLDMVYKQAPRELLHLLSPLNPIPSQLRYLQYVSRRNVATQWPPLDRALTLDCVIVRMIPNFDGEGGCRPIFRIYGQDPFLVSDRAPKVLFSSPKKSKAVRHYKQAECELAKIDINCHIQGDVVLECISLHDDTQREQMMFRVMFNTAFIRSNILMLNRDDIDILWDAKELFPKDFRAEILFSEMDTTASIVPVDCSCFEEKDGLPVEAFAKVQEIFSSVDWLVPKGDAAVEVLQHLTVSNTVIEAYSHGEKSQVNQSLAELEVNSVARRSTDLTSESQSNFSSKLSPNADADRKPAEPHYAPSEIGAIVGPKQTLNPPGDDSPASSTSPVHQLSIAETLQSDSNAQQSDMPKYMSPLSEAEKSFPETFPSTPPPQPPKDADVSPGQSLSSPTTLICPLTPSLEDKIGIQSGVPSSSLLVPQMPGTSSPSSKEDTVIRPGISFTSAKTHVSHGEVIRGGPPLSETPSTASSTENVVETISVATLPPPPPPPPPPPVPPPTHSSAEVAMGKSSRSGSPTSTNQLSTLNVQATGGGPPLHLSTPKSDVALTTVPPAAPPPPNINATPVKENSDSSCGLTPIAPLLPPTFASKEKLVCGVGPPPPPPPPPPFSPHLTDSAANRSTPCPPLPPMASLSEGSSIRGMPPMPAPPPPPPLSSLSKEHLASGVVPPPPLTPTLRDNNSVDGAAPCTPPSPLTPSPLTPPLRDNNSIARPAPSPPLPPLMPPKEGSSGVGPPLPPPAPSFVQSPRSTNPPTLTPPPPPPAPANNLGPAKGSSPSVPSAPPPPLHSNKEANLSNSETSNGGNSLSAFPSPPPPSAPPPGTKGKSLLNRTVTSRNNQTKKLKPLHWLKISRAVSGSLWAEAQKSGEASKAPEIDISELESLFAAAPNPDQGGRKTGSRASMGQKSEKVQLIEHRRAYNCEIMLSKVKIPLHDMLSSVLALEDSALDVDQVDNLIKFCPTKEEMEVLKGYKGEIDKLGKCEQFFLELMQVPRIEYKLRVFSFKIQFSSQVSDLRKSLNVVNSAADEIKGSTKLKRIMQTILSLGNALNQGTARGAAIGFRLDSLLKLTETRARNNKMTLMHYLCKVLSDKLPELLDFWKDLTSLEPASKIQLKFLAEEMQAINKGLEKVMQELSMSESDGPVSDQFRKALKEFLCFSEGEVRSLASLYAGVGRNVDSLILYFGEDPARCPFEQVISTLLNFMRMFKQAHEENCKQLEFEKKKAEKEASEMLKMKASDTGHLLQPLK
ncbi:WASP-interacting protein VRP1/WIP, contains WH2 domain [Handroanthus impetiginosus]|uniref:Formin-like protein n=1 Tax=Handroanthus impetiginosus TaxID=429701 RepID=A0A2G9G1N9_9LAMI|nr:WASP-interacting protein VRP1/WIP, contains WH2 domain [Handroanthus impetiginosus]